MHNSFSVVAFIGAWLTTIGGVWFLFEKADETLAPEVRSRLSAWLRNVPTAGFARDWPGQFTVLFDRLFGAKHMSWFRFRRSAVASFLTSWIVGACWVGSHPPKSLRLALGALILVTLSTLLCSVAPDYVSLVETRLVLKWMRRGGSILLWLLLDAVLTAALGGSVYAAAMAWKFGPSTVPHTYWGLMTFQVFSTVDEYRVPLSPFFYATFFTSAWVWLFAIASPIVRLLSGLQHGFARLRAVLDIDEKPGRSLGLVAVLMVTTLFAAAAPILLVIRRAG